MKPVRQINTMIIDAEKRNRNVYCGPVFDRHSGERFEQIRIVLARTIEGQKQVKRIDGVWLCIVDDTTFDVR